MNATIKASIATGFSRVTNQHLSFKYTEVEWYVSRVNADVDLDMLRHWIHEVAAELGFIVYGGCPDFKNTFYVKF